MEDNIRDELVTTSTAEIIQKEESNEKNSIGVSGIIIDNIKESVNDLRTKSGDVHNKLEDIAGRLRELKFTSDVEAKIESGELILEGDRVKDATTKRYVKKGDLVSVDLGEEDKRELVEIGKSVGKIVGQAQLYDLTKKIETLVDSVNEIREFLDDERKASLTSMMSDLRLIVVDDKYTEKEKERVNNYISEFGKLAYQYEQELKRKIGSDLYKSEMERIFEKFKESPFWVSTDDELKRLNNQVKSLGVLQQGYVYSKIGQIKCFEILEEYNKCDVVKSEFIDSYKQYESDITGYIAYLINDSITPVSELNKVVNLAKYNKNLDSVTINCLESWGEIGIDEEFLLYNTNQITITDMLFLVSDKEEHNGE